MVNEKRARIPQKTYNRLIEVSRIKEQVNLDRNSFSVDNLINKSLDNLNKQVREAQNN